MLMDKRDTYRSFEYPQFEELHTKLMHGYWHPGEVSLDEDVNDFKFKLTDDERVLVGRILKNFVQSEIHIGCFWGDFVSSWFKKPEIQDVARFISGAETIHTKGYDKLNVELGLADYESLKEDKRLYARIQMLINKKARTPENILKQLFLYSVMGEGVSLFSSFLILFSFPRKNLLKGTGQIISWSSIDENCHSDVGTLLFNTMKREYNLFNEEMKNSLYEIADEVVDIEMSLIDRCFEGLNVDTIIKPEVVKNYVKNRANKQLKKAGLNKRYDVDKSLLEESAFFETSVFGESVVDFFANKSTEYSVGAVIIDDKSWETT